MALRAAGPAEESAESSDDHGSDPCHREKESGVTHGTRVMVIEPIELSQPRNSVGRIALLKPRVTIALKHLHEKLHWQGPDPI